MKINKSGFFSLKIGSPVFGIFVSLLLIFSGLIFTPTIGNPDNFFVYHSIDLAAIGIGLLLLLFSLVKFYKIHKMKIRHIFLRLFLAGILAMIFLLVCMIFMKEATGLPFDEMAKIGSINMWRTVFIFGLLTSVFVFVFFWKKIFRSTAYLLVLCWILGTSIVTFITIQDSNLNTTIQQDEGANKLNFVSQRNNCSLDNAIRAATNCTVTIVRDDGGHGTAFSVKPGYAVTNKHVIEGARELKTWIDGEKAVKVWNYSPTYDLAVVKLPVEIPTCQWFDSKQLTLGEDLVAVGWPNTPTGTATVTKGIMSRWNEFEGGLEFIQTDASINPGNSGGPLMNECGVVGINTLKESWSQESLPRPLEGLGNALSSNFVASLIDKLTEEGKVQDVPLSSSRTYSSGSNPRSYQPSNIATLDISTIEGYRNKIVDVKNSWMTGTDRYPQEDIRKLLDSLERQILFCNKLIERLNESGGRASKEDLYMWDSIKKMSYESAEITNRLNAYH